MWSSQYPGTANVMVNRHTRGHIDISGKMYLNRPCAITMQKMNAINRQALLKMYGCFNVVTARASVGQPMKICKRCMISR